MADERKPIIFSIDDDPQVLRSLRRDLRGEYRRDYRIISTESAKEGLEAFDRGQFDRAYVLWKPLAENGYTAAQYSLGWIKNP